MSVDFIRDKLSCKALEVWQNHIYLIAISPPPSVSYIMKSSIPDTPGSMAGEVSHALGHIHPVF